MTGFGMSKNLGNLKDLQSVWTNNGSSCLPSPKKPNNALKIQLDELLPVVLVVHLLDPIVLKDLLHQQVSQQEEHLYLLFLHVLLRAFLHPILQVRLQIGAHVQDLACLRQVHVLLHVEHHLEAHLVENLHQEAYLLPSLERFADLL